MNDIEVGSKRTSGNSTTMNYEQVGGNAAHRTKKNRSNDVMMRLLLAGNDCGAIVGKDGENLNRLRKEFYVDLQMPNSRTLARVFIMSGQLDSCLCVISDILKHVRKAPYRSFPQDNPFEINLLVEDDLVGTIIGKSGAKMKEIREQSDSRVKVYTDCLPNSNERVVAIGSDQAQKIGECVRMIFNILQNAERRAKPYYYDPNTSVGMPGNNRDYPSLESGRNITHTQNIGVDNLAAEFLEATTETNITVSNDNCSAIIGKGGSNIREIREASGAQVTISGELNERVITITGTLRQVKFVEQLLTQSCVHASAE